MRQFLVLCLLVLFLSGTWCLAEAVEPLKAYDNFEVGPISPDRWNGFSFGGDNSSAVSYLYEESRTIVVDPSGVGRNLRILNRSYGKTDSNNGVTLASYGLAFKNPATVTAIRARVQVLSQPLEKNCPANGAEVHGGGAELSGFFFNAGNTPPTPGNGTDDVFAAVGISPRGNKSNCLNPSNCLEVFTTVIRCGDPDCTSGQQLGFVPLGKVNVGQWARVLVQWDQANQQFIFQRDTQAPQVVSYAGKVVSDTLPPGLAIKRIGALTMVHNCTDATGSSRPSASVNALFDNVFVNQSAIP